MEVVGAAGGGEDGGSLRGLPDIVEEGLGAGATSLRATTGSAGSNRSM